MKGVTEETTKNRIVVV